MKAEHAGTTPECSGAREDLQVSVAVETRALCWGEHTHVCSYWANLPPPASPHTRTDAAIHRKERAEY